jgi:hypothetical protein
MGHAVEATRPRPDVRSRRVTGLTRPDRATRSWDGCGEPWC